MLVITFFVLLFVCWYILVDQIASSRVEYQFPASCCGCGSQSDLKLWSLRRDWYFGGIDVLEHFFPEPVREAVIPICKTCLSRVEAHKKRNLIIAVTTSVVLTIPLAILINHLVKRTAFCVGSISINFCVSISWAIGGILGGFILFGILWELTSFLPGLALPARFNLFGKLRFTNPDYWKAYNLLNPSPEIPIPQRQIPWGIYVGAFLALAVSILSDVDMIINGHRRDPSLLIFPIYYVLILEKAGAAVLFLKFKEIAFLLWPVIIASELVMNPKFNIQDRAEDILFASALLLIFLYKYWQTYRNKKLSIS